MSPKELIPNQSKIELYEFIRTVLTGVVTTCVVYGVSMIQDVSDLAKAHEILIKQEQSNISNIEARFDNHVATDMAVHVEHDKRLRTIEVMEGIKPN
jgi:hypothetical protein